MSIAQDTLPAQLTRNGAPYEPRAYAHAGFSTGEISLALTSDLASLREDWRAFERFADCTPFQSYGWLAAWQKHIGEPAGVTPAIVIGRRKNALSFILPLAVERSGLVRRLTFLGHDLGDYNAPLLAPDFRADADFVGLWNEICGRLQSDARWRHDVVMLDKLPERVGGQPNPFRQLKVALNPSGAYVTTFVGDWDAYLVAKRSSSRRQRDRSKRKNLAKHGPLALVKPNTLQERTDTLTRLMDQKQRAFDRMGVANLFARPGYDAFYRELATNPETREFVYISRLDVGDTAAACNMGVVFRGGFYHILASYDDGPLSKFGAGAIHLQEVMRDARESGCDLFDFTIGDEPYKREWAEHELLLYDHLSSATLKGSAVVMVSTQLRNLKRRIKQSKRLWPLAVALRARLGALKSGGRQNRSDPQAPSHLPGAGDER